MSSARFILPPIASLVAAAFATALLVADHEDRGADPSAAHFELRNDGSDNSLTDQFQVRLTPDYSAAFRDLETRPLFTPGRTPPGMISPEPEVVAVIAAETVSETAVPSEPQPSITPAEPNIKLLGIHGRGDLRAALIASGAETPELWMHVGQTVDGWILVSIAENQILIRNGAAEKVVRLFQ